MKLDKVTKARTNLLLDQPFWGALALRLELKADYSIPTACTNGKHLKYNPEFVNKLPMPQLLGLLAHEVMHCALGHPWRRDQRDMKKWNVACDMAINPLLEQSGFTLPPNGLQGDGNESAEQIYAKLPDNPPQSSPFGEVEDGEGEDGEQLSESQKELAKQEWQVAMQQAANQAKVIGCLPAGMDRFITELLKPKFDLTDFLRIFFDHISKNDYSWRVPNRRYTGNIILPSLYNLEIGHCVIAVDTSGSIDQLVLNSFAEAITGVLETFSSITIDVLYCDTKITNHEIFGTDDLPIQLQAKGGGGTDFRPPFEWVNENLERPPCALIYLTDLYGEFPEHAPEYPVLWTTINDEIAPWGETIKLES